MGNYFRSRDGNILENSITDISNQDIIELIKMNQRDQKECEMVTQSTHRGESYFDKFPNKSRQALYAEVLYRDRKTAGFIMVYPHGTIITQPERNNYYRGENQMYSCSTTSLSRKIVQLESDEDRAIYSMISDMRICEFGIFLSSFDYVQNWERNYGTVLFEALAQHYGLETHWLDITNDFLVALFFATCYFDKNENKWKPLTKNETEITESTKYGMIFRCPQWQVRSRNSLNLQVDAQKTKKHIFSSSVLPIGFQPFMRCHMQYGYGIKNNNNYSLQQDVIFEKLRFRHDETLSNYIFNLMDQGKKIYPHEGLLNYSDVIDQIKTANTFSEDAFEYAFERNDYFDDKDLCRDIIKKSKLLNMEVAIAKDAHPFHLSRQRRRTLDRKYAKFSIEKTYGIKLSTRLIKKPVIE